MNPVGAGLVPAHPVLIIIQDKAIGRLIAVNGDQDVPASGDKVSAIVI